MLGSYPSLRDSSWGTFSCQVVQTKPRKDMCVLQRQGRGIMEDLGLQHQVSWLLVNLLLFFWWSFCLFIYLLLYWVFAVCMGFSLAVVSGASLCCGAQVSHCGGLSCWDMRNLPGLGIKPSVPCVGRQVLIHCATREVSACRFYYALLLPLGLSW